MPTRQFQVSSGWFVHSSNYFAAGGSRPTMQFRVSSGWLIIMMMRVVHSQSCVLLCCIFEGYFVRLPTT